MTRAVCVCRLTESHLQSNRLAANKSTATIFPTLSVGRFLPAAAAIDLDGPTGDEGWDRAGANAGGVTVYLQQYYSSSQIDSSNSSQTIIEEILDL